MVYNIMVYWFDLLEMPSFRREVGDGRTKNILQIFKEYFLSFLVSLLDPEEERNFLNYCLKDSCWKKKCAGNKDCSWCEWIIERFRINFSADLKIYRILELFQSLHLYTWGKKRGPEDTANKYRCQDLNFSVWVSQWEGTWKTMPSPRGQRGLFSTNFLLRKCPGKQKSRKNTTVIHPSFDPTIVNIWHSCFIYHMRMCVGS